MVQSYPQLFCMVLNLSLCCVCERAYIDIVQMTAVQGRWVLPRGQSIMHDVIVLSAGFVGLLLTYAPVNVSARRVGGIRFLKVGRFCVSFCVTREYRPIKA